MSRGWLVAAMCSCVSLVVGMVSALNLAIPSLSAGVPHPSAQAVVWVVDGYVVFFACLLIPAGALADRAGRKGVLLAGMAVFAGGALVCALSPGVGVLIAGRMISGVGAAAVLPSTLALLVEGLAGVQRQRAVAAWASMTGVAAVLGNVGGGAAIQYGGWRALFWFVVPLSIGAIALAAIAAPVTTRHDRPADVPATVLLTSGFLALLYAIVSAPRFGWLGRPVLGSAAIAVVLLAAWVWHELHSAHPLLDPRLFAIPSVRAGALGMAALFVGMFGLFYLNGQFLQYVQGDTPLGSGVRLLPMAAALLAGPRCGLVVERGLGTRAAMAGGMVVLACGLATVSSVGPHSPYVLYAAGACLTALGCGIATPVLSHAMLGALPPGRSGVGSGLQSLVRELGSALGVAVCGTVTTAVFTANLPSSLRGPTGPTTVAAALTHPVPRAAVLQAFTDGLHAATLGLAGAVALSAALIATWLPSNQD